LPTPDPEETQLVEGLLSRDESSVEAFLERYRSLLFHCIGQFARDAAQRDDLYQDLLMHTLERLDRGAFNPERGSLGTWLYRVAWCRCVDLRRRESARRRPQLTMVGDDMPEKVDESPSPPELAGGRELSAVVRHAMSDLLPEERTLLNLRFVDGLALGEVGRACGISLEQTKYRLRRATVALRRRLLLVHTAGEVSL
jgi:RNA polymerase sigma-70 factor, ECF subfamily